MNLNSSPTSVFSDLNPGPLMGYCRLGESNGEQPASAQPERPGDFQQNDRKDAQTRQLNSAHAQTAFPPQHKGMERQCATAQLLQYGEASDDALIDAAKAGDGRAFSELSERYARVLYQKIYRVVRNREDSQDLLQETLWKAYNHLDQFRGTSKFSTWLIKIGINSSLMLLRKRRRSLEISYDSTQESETYSGVWDFPDPSPNAEQIYARDQTRRQVVDAIQKLPLSYQRVVRQYHEQERSTKEVAHTLGISLAAAKSRLLRARVSLRAALAKQSFSSGC